MVLAALLAVTITLMVRRRMATWLDLGLLLLTAGFAGLPSWRTVPAAAMMIVPLAAAQARPRDADPDRRIARRERLLVVGGAVAALLAWPWRCRRPRTTRRRSRRGSTRP